MTPTRFERADPAALAAFDPSTKICTMNCGPAAGDPRSRNERKLLCDDCMDAPPRPPEKTCSTCAHHSQRGSIESFDSSCFECSNYYASKWEAKP